MLVHAFWMVYRNQLVYYKRDTAYLSIGFAKFSQVFASAQNDKGTLSGHALGFIR